MDIEFQHVDPQRALDNLILVSIVGGSSSLWSRLHRSTSEVSLSMNIEYCLRSFEAMAETSDGVLPKAGELLEPCSLEIFNEEATMAGVSFAFL